MEILFGYCCHLGNFEGLPLLNLCANGNISAHTHADACANALRQNFTNRFHHAFVIFSDFCHDFFKFNINFSLNIESSKHDGIWTLLLKLKENLSLLSLN